jgi:alpha-ketoglutarate-dependent taurine dioxygenase
MLTIEPMGAVLGATVRGIDLARPLREPALGRILLALGKHGMLRFSDQYLNLGALKRFSEQFGEIQAYEKIRNCFHYQQDLPQAPTAPWALLPRTMRFIRR